MARSATPNQLKQEVAFLRQKLNYQQKLLEDERKITDDLLSAKNQALIGVQVKVQELEQQHSAHLAQQQRQHQIALEERDRQYQSTLDALASKHQEAATKLQAEYQSSMEQTKQEHNDQIQQLQNLVQAKINRLQEEHRNQLRRKEQQHQNILAETEDQNRQQIARIRNEAQHSIKSTFDKMQQQMRGLRKEYDSKLDQVKESYDYYKDFEEKDQIIASLKEKYVLLSRSVDKKTDEINKQFARDLQTVRDEAQRELQASKSSYQEILRKIEQRCYRLESEKSQLKQQYESLMEESIRKHREDLSLVQHEKYQSVKDMQSDFESKLKSLEQTQKQQIEQLTIKFKLEIDRLNADHQYHSDKAKDEYERQLVLYRDQVSQVENQLQDARRAQEHQEQQFKDREQAFQSEISLRATNVRHSLEQQLANYKQQYVKLQDEISRKEAYVESAKESNDLLKTQFDELRIELDAQALKFSGDRQHLESVIMALRDEAKKAVRGQAFYHRKYDDIKRELNDRTNTIKILESKLNEMESSKVKPSSTTSAQKSLSTTMRSVTEKQSPVKSKVTAQNPPRNRVTAEVTTFSKPLDTESIMNLTLEDRSDLRDNLDASFSSTTRSVSPQNQKIQQLKDDLHDVIESHIGRIEGLTNELQRSAANFNRI